MACTKIWFANAARAKAALGLEQGTLQAAHNKHDLLKGQHAWEEVGGGLLNRRYYGEKVLYWALAKGLVNKERGGRRGWQQPRNKVEKTAERQVIG